jgi:hypothetical protein
MARRRSKHEDWRPAFLEAFAQHYTVTLACKAVGISRQAAYAERQRNKAFAEAWADVETQTTEFLERELIRRAAESWVERERWEVDTDGNRVLAERVTKWSDSNLQFLLRARKPETYRENVRVDHGGTVSHNLGVSLLNGRQVTEIPGPQRRAAAALLLRGIDDDYVVDCDEAE